MISIRELCNVFSQSLHDIPMLWYRLFSYISYIFMYSYVVIFHIFSYIPMLWYQLFPPPRLSPRSLRVNYWYLNVYVLWLNTILNIVLPIVSLIVLNSLVSRTIKEHLRNLDTTTERASVRNGNILHREVGKRTIKTKILASRMFSLNMSYVVDSALVYDTRCYNKFKTL